MDTLIVVLAAWFALSVLVAAGYSAVATIAKRRHERNGTAIDE